MKAKQIQPIHDFYHMLTLNASLFGSKALFRFHCAEETKEVSYEGLLQMVRRLSAAAGKLGIAGSHTAIIGETSVPYVAAYLSTIVSGGVSVPLDKETAPDEILNFIRRAEVSTVFYGDAFHDLFTSRRAEIPAVTHFIRMPADTFTEGVANPTPPTADCTVGALLDYGAFLLESGESAFDGSGADPHVMSTLLFTSGTTGTSKGVMLSQKNICAVINSAHQQLTISPNDILLSVLPIHHTYEMTCGILAPMVYGATICLSDGIRYVAKNIKEFRPTLMTVVPLLVNQLHKAIWKAAEKKGSADKLRKAIALSNTLLKWHIDLRPLIFKQVRAAFGGRLSKLVSGGAALNPLMVDNFKAFGITISQGYGITECAPLLSAIPFDVYNPASCGIPSPGVEVRIDKDSPDELAGEIVVRGENVMLGYYKNPEATQEVLSADGWFRTGDYGYLDDAGFLYITGRKKNVIVLEGGKNVFPEEIEEYLEPLPLVEEVVVVGRTAKDGESIHIVALIYPNLETAEEAGLTTPEQIKKVLTEQINQLNKKLPTFKKIHALELRETPFEKTTTKKIKRLGLQSE
ncbi:MAG: AMP-binding protein [Eubacteriales bacterium]